MATRATMSPVTTVRAQSRHSYSRHHSSEGAARRGTLPLSTRLRKVAMGLCWMECRAGIAVTYAPIEVCGLCPYRGLWPMPLSRSMAYAPIEVYGLCPYRGLWPMSLSCFLVFGSCVNKRLSNVQEASVLCTEDVCLMSCKRMCVLSHMVICVITHMSGGRLSSLTASWVVDITK